MSRVHCRSPSTSSCSSAARPVLKRQRLASHNDRLQESEQFIANLAPVARIMKTSLPDNAKIAKDAKECMQECVSEFISFITSEGASSTWQGGAGERLTRLMFIRSCSSGEVPAGET